MHSEHGEFLAKINDTGEYNDEVEAGLKSAVEDFKAKGTW